MTGTKEKNAKKDNKKKNTRTHTKDLSEKKKIPDGQSDEALKRSVLLVPKGSSPIRNPPSVARTRMKDSHYFEDMKKQSQMAPSAASTGTSTAGSAQECSAVASKKLSERKAKPKQPPSRGRSKLQKVDKPKDSTLRAQSMISSEKQAKAPPAQSVEKRPKTERKMKAKVKIAAPQTPSRQSAVLVKKGGGTKRKVSQATKEEVDKKNESVCDMLLDEAGKMLAQHLWYHGFLPRQDCEDLIKNIGDYIVRRTTVDKRPAYTITVGVADGPDIKCSHIQIFHEMIGWRIEDICKATIPKLIEFYSKNPAVTLTNIQIGTGPLLVNPIPRPDFYLLHEDITLGDTIGKGAFGEVLTGKFKRKDGQVIPVAIKKLKQTDNANVKAKFLEFFKEGRLMLRFDHPNIVKVYGVAPGENPVLIVLELAAGGSLKSYCHKNEPVPSEQLLRFAKDACRGMNYLQSMNVIHRDLAARNCLLGANAELKISDFGLSHLGDTLTLDALKNVPIKWLSPETLTEGKFTHKTDVWSYGVLCWEIFSRCKSDPFPLKSNAEAKILIQTKTPPMDPPSGAPAVIMDIMNLCFTMEPTNRPDFEGIFRILLPEEKSPLSN